MLNVSTSNAAVHRYQHSNPCCFRCQPLVLGWHKKNQCCWIDLVVDSLTADDGRVALAVDVVYW